MYLTQALHRSLQQNPDRPATIIATASAPPPSRLTASRDWRARSRSWVCNGGDRVGILALNSDRYLEYFFAVPWAGAALNPVNIRWSVAEIAYSLVDSDTRVLFVDDAFAPMIPALREHGSGPGDGNPLRRQAERPTARWTTSTCLAERTRPADTRRGGVGTARRVLHRRHDRAPQGGDAVSHDNLLTSGDRAAWRSGHFLAPGGRLLHAAPMFHLADLAAWAAGCSSAATHVIVPMFKPAEVLRAIDEHGVTDVLLVPTMIQMLVDDPADRRQRPDEPAAG